jgi:hypothetical protein
MYEKLKDVFQIAAAKYLSAVDVKPSKSKPRKSNQHEIGGLKQAGIGDRIGYPENGEKWIFSATMVYIGNDSTEIISCEDKVTWYDTRFGKPRDPEYRLYYKSNEVSELFREGDFFLIALTQDNKLLMVFTPQGSQSEHQLINLFGATIIGTADRLKKIDFSEESLLLPVRLLLEQIGIDLYIETSEDEHYLEIILDTFGVVFPKTKLFSEFSRKTYGNHEPAHEDPDTLLVSWMDFEEKLFRILERHILSERLKEGFGESGYDVDEFISFSLSVQNRRKSRVGHAFENHIEEILKLNELEFERGVKTEGKQTPDFLFPGHLAYHDKTFSETGLRMLGAKTTCKERWRQVLAEADRIPKKHLITMESSISEDQTDQMKSMNLQLVIPEPIHPTYLKSQQEWLFTFKDFIEDVKSSTARV